MAQAEQPKTNNSRYTQEYFDIARSLGPDCAGRRSAYAYMQNSSAIVHHQVVATSFIPRLFDKATYEVMKDTAETAHRIASQVMAHYLDDASYRKIFHYDPRMADLILAPRGYDAILPFARFDTFLNEDTLDIAFCEFNADGSSGMNENREITNSIKGTATFKEFARRHQVQGCELFESWVEDFLAIYKTYEQAKENPRVAIVDYLENGVVDEFRIFTKIFADHGIECIVEDVRALRFDGTVLKDRNGKTIDAIWRRCVSNDLMQFWDASQDLIRAVKRGKVALIGSFAGHIVHDKQLFEALFHEATLDFLSAEEREFVKKTVPRTTHLDSRFIDLDEILENKNSWIIKPTDHYGAEDV
ncbi:MAG: carboxylate--amine ligase, partial [Eggerthellaceae bacterium]